MSDMDDRTNAIALEIIESGVNLPPLPTAGAQLLSFAQQPVQEIDVAEFTKLVESDPALCIKVLQLANSSYFGAANKISSLRQAILHIGLEETINAAYWFFCQNALPKLPVMEGFSGQAYWAHSWACAVANRMLGHPEFMVKTLPGELYVAGLLHGIGKLILAIYHPNNFSLCIKISKEQGHTLEAVEKEVFGTTDSLIAYRVMKAWQLPANICAAARYYLAPQAAEDEYREIAALTQLSYVIANTSGVGDSGDQFCYDLSQTWISTHGSGPLADEAIQKRITQEIYDTLSTKALNHTGVAARGRKMEGRAPETNSGHKRQTSGVSSPARQNGFWAWFRSLLGVG